MTLRVSKDKVFYAFAPELIPAASVRLGDVFILETHDCFQGQLKNEADRVDGLDWSHINPATGPVFIEGVKAGDVVCFELIDVRVGAGATMVTIPGEGALGDVITEMETTILPFRNGEVIFKNKIHIPIKPMVGVIGLAPAVGSIATGTPGIHGGNMDCTLIGGGARLYLTAGVDGGLFGCGDLHAVMGDGEIVVCGAETPGEVHVRASLVSLKGLPTPFLETDDLAVAISSAVTVDEASSRSIHNMAQFLTDTAGIRINDAGMLMSLVGSLKFCQVVDPEKTVRFEFPKKVLAEYGFRFR